MQIVEMTRQDVDAVSELDKKCFKISWSKKAFYDEMENDIAVYFVAKEDGRVIGYAGFWHIADEGDITNIAVDGEYRRRGVGAALLKELIKRARSEGMNLLTLEVRRSNTPAKALYAKFGFREIGMRRRYYSDNGEDAIIMALFLDD
ncbi:MAG: ribosomal protein S18-alanine N-acetyltransferase [Clostridiales bacterium]|nr:ribosomal protein S18-alanine N-acetyltransferase [Clostridiales bacterium]